MVEHRAGGSFGDYRLERLLGRGGMGEVWLARDRTGGTVALKVLSGAYSADPVYRRRFEREARLGAKVRNSHVVPVRAFGEVDEHLFLEMAYIEGIDLATRLRSGPLAPVRAVEVIAQTAGALDAAHAAGLVHRDVKPGNILLHTSGFVYLIDFGIARAPDLTSITASGSVVGTCGYMAPERFTGSVDARSDIYSLACVLYEILTGSMPFGDGEPAQQMRAHLMAEPPRASQVARGVPAALDTVIARGMAKNPDERYPSAGELAAAARAVMGPPSSVRPDSPIGDPAVSRGHPPTRVVTAAGPAPTRATAQPTPHTLEPPASSSVRTGRRPGGWREFPGGGWLSVAAGAALAAVAAWWLLSGGSDVEPGPDTTAGVSASAVTGPPPPSVGGVPAGSDRMVRDGNVAFAVTDVASNVADVGTVTASGSYTVVTLTVTNLSGRTLTIPISEQRLVTVEGKSVAPDATATAGLHPSGSDFDELAPGATATIRVAFDLPGKDDKKNEKDKKKDDKTDEKKDDAASHLILHGELSSPGATVPIR
ncbi:serine/threonine-protein kinase [Nocardia abscessus]|uniref:serine/threonine-protein kinase n=1 Tax=Nocardia abscessus TaxID=120957 RepID=UPI002455CA8E|nr:serine/threonine-protein kinase [Nocardia abscessus]